MNDDRKIKPHFGWDVLPYPKDTDTGRMTWKQFHTTENLTRFIGCTLLRIREYNIDGDYPGMLLASYGTVVYINKVWNKEFHCYECVIDCGEQAYFVTEIPISRETGRMNNTRRMKYIKYGQLSKCISFNYTEHIYCKDTAYMYITDTGMPISKSYKIQYSDKIGGKQPKDNQYRMPPKLKDVGHAEEFAIEFRNSDSHKRRDNKISDVYILFPFRIPMPSTGSIIDPWKWFITLMEKIKIDKDTSVESTTMENFDRYHMSEEEISDLLSKSNSMNKSVHRKHYEKIRELSFLFPKGFKYEFPSADRKVLHSFSNCLKEAIKHGSLVLSDEFKIYHRGSWFKFVPAGRVRHEK